VIDLAAINTPCRGAGAAPVHERLTIQGGLVRGKGEGWSQGDGQAWMERRLARMNSRPLTCKRSHNEPSVGRPRPCGGALRPTRRRTRFKGGWCVEKGKAGAKATAKPGWKGDGVLDSRGAGARKRGRLEPRRRPSLDDGSIPRPAQDVCRPLAGDRIRLAIVVRIAAGTINLGHAYRGWVGCASCFSSPSVWSGHCSAPLHP
jgi:hypothetical protein